MANYNAASRTNYFKVKDIEAFKKSMSKISAEDLEVWEDTSSDGETLVAFGGFDVFTEVYLHEDDDDFAGDYLVDISEIIQPHLCDGEVCIIFESGYEKLRYVTGSAYVITKDKAEYLTIEQFAIERARELTGNFEKRIKTCY